MRDEEELVLHTTHVEEWQADKQTYEDGCLVMLLARKNKDGQEERTSSPVHQKVKFEILKKYSQPPPKAFSIDRPMLIEYTYSER